MRRAFTLIELVYLDGHTGIPSAAWIAGVLTTYATPGRVQR